MNLHYSLVAPNLTSVLLRSGLRAVTVVCITPYRGFKEIGITRTTLDVGGGSVANGTPHTLARIALRWMIRECFKTETGIIFSTAGLRSVGLDPATLYPYVQQRPAPLPVGNLKIGPIPSNKTKELENFADVHNSEEHHELHDAMSPHYDQLKFSLWPCLAWVWWFLELIPIHQKEKNESFWQRRWNLARGRAIPHQRRLRHPIKIHRSVQLRMAAEYPGGAKYVPAASFQKAIDHGNVEWVA